MPADAALGEVLLAMVDRAWQDRFGRWIDEPEEEAPLDAAVFFDFRRLHGELDTEDALRPVIRRAAGNRRFLGRLARRLALLHSYQDHVRIAFQTDLIA
jgi:signal-transduction protein with cAMP-binding, CBS, and nucleotidyltransferase domain